MVYPEVYYKVQPYIIMMCDEMDAYGTTMPSQEMIEEMTDRIYDDVCTMYPELSDYAAETAVEVQWSPYGGYGGYGYRRRRPRRRTGFLGDLINILLLSEFFGRRRRRYYW
jgi:hypothetical protein